jgi:hypothetical protein
VVECHSRRPKALPHSPQITLPEKQCALLVRRSLEQRFLTCSCAMSNTPGAMIAESR